MPDFIAPIDVPLPLTVAGRPVPPMRTYAPAGHCEFLLLDESGVVG